MQISLAAVNFKIQLGHKEARATCAAMFAKFAFELAEMGGIIRHN